LLVWTLLMMGTSQQKSKDDAFQQMEHLKSWTYLCAAAAEEHKNKGGPCEFDLTQSGLWLHPIKFIAHSMTKEEQSWHAYLGKA